MITNYRIGYNGRFGNQIFQFASTIGIARKLNYNVAFPKSNIINGILQTNADGKNFTARLDIINCFDIDDKFFVDNIEIKNNINEKFFHFDDDLFKITDNTNIDGYLQSEKYFKHCDVEIKEILKIKEPFIEIANEIIPKKDKELVAIHVRRADYLYLDGYHSLNGVEYVNSAIKLFEDKDKYHFMVCSDDTKWCDSVWGDNDDFTVMKTNSPYVDFTLMSLCDHHIISNSSFSWWSSYLSKNKNKKVVAPKNWFGEKMLVTNLKDLYRDEMIIV
jgi:hypothetical protein